MEYITLNNGIKMPMLGYGVYQVTKTNASDVYWTHWKQAIV